jgi:hypothetical protein
VTGKVVSAVVDSMMEGLLAHVKPFLAEELKQNLDKLAADCVAKCIDEALGRVKVECVQHGEKMTVQFEYKEAASK